MDLFNETLKRQATKAKIESSTNTYAHPNHDNSDPARVLLAPLSFRSTYARRSAGSQDLQLLSRVKSQDCNYSTQHRLSPLRPPSFESSLQQLHHIVGSHLHRRIRDTTMPSIARQVHRTNRHHRFLRWWCARLYLGIG